jgi:hypothetical protein
MLYSIVPVEEIWAEADVPVPERRDVIVNGCMMQVESTGTSLGRVVRVLSTDPEHYLKPEYQPGSFVVLTDSML